jgi:hypothetical protein
LWRQVSGYVTICHRSFGKEASMFNDAQTPADSPGNDGSTRGELETLERRLSFDGSLEGADVPADANRAELVSTRPDDASVTEAEGDLGESVLDTHAVSTAAIGIPRRPYRQPPALVAVVATMTVVLLVALVLATFARGPMQMSATTGDQGTVTTTADGISTTTNVPTTTAASTTTAAATSPVGSAGGTGGTGGTPPGDVPLQVTALSLTVDRSSVNGVCQDDNYFNLTLTISIAPGSQGGLVDFTVVPSDSTVQAISSNLLFGSIDTSETITFGENIRAQYGDGTPHSVQAQTTSPNAVSSQPVSLAVTCIREVTGATASVTPNVWNAPCARTQAFTFTFTITVTPGPPISVIVARNTSGGFAEWYPPTQTFSNVTGGTIKYSGTGTLYSPTAGQGGGNGTYWQSITVTGPNTVTSNQATITESC